MKKSSRKLLIVAPYQFGELSDCYYWAKYAHKEGWSVTYLGYCYKGERSGRERKYNGVKTVRIQHRSNRIMMALCFYVRLLWEIMVHNHQNVIACNMPGIQILPALFPKRSIVLDIRTLSVSGTPEQRQAANQRTLDIVKRFRHVSVISEGVRDFIRPVNGHCHLLPLGAEPLSTKPKSFDKLRLFYIGVLTNRDLDVFLEGLQLFYEETNYDFTFDIIGTGDAKSEKRVNDAISKFPSGMITRHGFLTHEKARPLFDICNVGVCYVPTTEYFEYQPPTKLFEYCLSGMACIATSTYENKKYITGVNGAICNADAESVRDTLKQLVSQLSKFDSSRICDKMSHMHWRVIVQHSLLTIFAQ